MASLQRETGNRASMDATKLVNRHNRRSGLQEKSSGLLQNYFKNFDTMDHGKDSCKKPNRVTFLTIH
jgi:hypothetical protein